MVQHVRSKGNVFVATKRLFLDSDREKVVTEDDPKAAVLLAAVGQEIEEELVEKYGLNVEPKAAAPEKIAERKTATVEGLQKR